MQFKRWKNRINQRVRKVTELDEVFLEDTNQQKGFSVVLANRDFMKLWIGQLMSIDRSSVTIKS